ncbi:hypothetical protein AA103196_2832 [Ameyamaea chiangmaiensis NBRC 103196]|nr:hypothetical protein AA103196_2832 [Ameyamaea chiangmaiensis NBRC 103196]
MLGEPMEAQPPDDTEQRDQGEGEGELFHINHPWCVRAGVGPGGAAARAMVHWLHHERGGQQFAPNVVL